mgnify:CR=1 FL=1
MKKGKILFAITGTIILLLQSILPAVAIDESEDLKSIKAELESMIPEEELGKYGKGEVIGEAYIDQEESYHEEKIQRKQMKELCYCLRWDLRL